MCVTPIVLLCWHTGSATCRTLFPVLPVVRDWTWFDFCEISVGLHPSLKNLRLQCLQKKKKIMKKKSTNLSFFSVTYQSVGYRPGSLAYRENQNWVNLLCPAWKWIQEMLYLEFPLHQTKGAPWRATEIHCTDAEDTVHSQPLSQIQRPPFRLPDCVIFGWWRRLMGPWHWCTHLLKWNQFTFGFPRNSHCSKIFL